MDSRQQTLRMTGLPPSTHREDVENFFGDRVKRKGRQIIESIGPICQDANTANRKTTVSFSSHDAAVDALSLEHTKRRLVAVRGGADIVSLDHSFEDITTLHSSANPQTGHPDIDIVALHGLTGHAWNTFTTSELIDKQGDRIQENNWLRDNLPHLLEQSPQQKIYSRVMTFGYNADVWMTKSVADLEAPVNNLIWYLETERHQDPQRPLFFIGHSLGGIVIKEAIVTMANEAMKKTIDPSLPAEGRYIFPVKGCMFFGVPHKGAEIADKASGFLSTLGLMFNVNTNNIRDLKSKSQRLANISSEFRSIQSQHRIPVVSFYETEKYNKALGLIVSPDSAVFTYDGNPRPFGVNRNHKDMAKFSNDGAHALQPAVYFLANVAKEALVLQTARSGAVLVPPPQPAPVDGEGHKIEDRFSILESYDTVFLIDDSPSMGGENWELVQKILDYSTVVATRYDTDGIDIHFLNNTKANQNNVRDPEIAVQIHHDITLRGSTPLLYHLSRHLRGYLQKFREAKCSVDYKCYNLIVLTDGEPNDEREDEGDISDQEDAKKNKAAFRLIRKKIIEVAKILDSPEVDAELGQVGIQFCQIGNDRDATAFFEFLDDRLKGKAKLGRDMVDTIKCQSEVDLTKKFFEKLLLGAIDKLWDHEKMETQSPKFEESSHRQEQPSSTLPYRLPSMGKGKERQFSDDDTLVGSSTRWNSFPTPANSTLQTLYEAQRTDDPTSQSKKPMSTFEERPSENTHTSQQPSPPLTGRVPRRTTFDHTLIKTEEPDEVSPPRRKASSRWKRFG